MRKPHRRPTSLDLLPYTKVTDAGLKHLAGMKRLPHLDLRHTQVTESKVAELQNALPNCRLIFD
jgi:hypothetical protein